MITCIYEFFNISKKGGFNSQVIPGIIISLFIYALFFLINQNILNEKFFLAIIPFFILIPTIEIFRKKENKILNIIFTLAGVIYFSIPFGLFNLILTPIENSPEILKPEVLIGLFIIVWINDAGAYIVGKLLGKHKMVEKISPNKTWEGAIGGAILSILFSILYFSFFNYFSIPVVILISITTVFAGTIGDLTESIFKRHFNVKDSGNIMPGHGGMFDRFDSLIFAAPVFYIFITLFLN